MQALRSMQQAVTLQPGSANFHANLGELLRRLGRWKEAEASFRSALAISPSDAEFMYALGLVLAQQGRQAEAMQAYRAGIATGTPIPQVQHALGIMLAQQGQLAEARLCFEGALAVAPNFAPAKQCFKIWVSVRNASIHFSTAPPTVCSRNFLSSAGYKCYASKALYEQRALSNGQLAPCGDISYGHTSHQRFSVWFLVPRVFWFVYCCHRRLHPDFLVREMEPGHGWRRHACHPICRAAAEKRTPTLRKVRRINRTPFPPR